MGGLGNQMFQYAAARSLAQHLGTNVKVDVSFLNADAKGIYTQRDYELNVFSAAIEIISEKELECFLKKYHSKFRSFLHQKFSSLFPSHILIENGYHFHPEFFKLSRNTYLNGFWQSEKYFVSARNTIQNDFVIKPNFLGGTEKWENLITHSESVSLHVRRGDYVSNPTSYAYHGVCDANYYNKAVELVASKKKNLKLFIFSDDLKWCQENLHFELPHFFVETDSNIKDLYLMSTCKHNVTANSSFSWWAAWLNKFGDKIVIAPSRWFAQAELNSADRIPESWIIL
jgi:hypothetical protein